MEALAWAPLSHAVLASLDAIHTARFTRKIDYLAAILAIAACARNAIESIAGGAHEDFARAESLA